MGDSEKPFACPSPGCNMSFTNEDHLVVHKKKHDMVLNLGNNGKNTFVADQTPTPTRFIRNCEEVGLFQDLQNVNPFEETFRRAVEAGKTGSLSEPEVGGTDDTLHTPHIFPNISDVSSSTVALPDKKSEENPPETSSRTDIIEERSSSLVTRQTSKNVEIIIESNEEIETHSSRIVVHETETSVTPKISGTTQSTSNLQINGQEVQLLLKTADGKLMQLSAIPFCENRINHSRENGLKHQSVSVQNNEPSFKCITEDINDVKKEATISSSSKMTLAKMRLKQALTKNGTVAVSPMTNGVIESAEKSKNTKGNEKIASNMEQRRKQEVQARNRASSMRARAKRKVWIQQLQRTANNANEKNAVLQLEVKALRSEVAKLRGLLLAHESCSVTKAIQKGSLVAVGAKTPSADVPVIQNIRPAPMNVVQAIKRNASLVETPIAPKIPKQSTLSYSLSSNPHVILPKADVRPGPIVKDVSGLKIVEVRSLATDNEQGKRIVLMPNATRRFEFVRSSSRSIIHVNSPSMQIENAASKCTGT